ncbi:hypothetical protein [Shewanella zhangzhouensis]|uniref:hypothetical protein n=1 Tax=Shewanella zhangzhouensis TaxID=2864213 RepID=UPI001C6553CA|nr:hypothetical protein [Shewanella zhangzhouensis]QYK04593.1 hypothetical protein K0H63_16260 [Shewanella zhangzhouensis]
MSRLLFCLLLPVLLLGCNATQKSTQRAPANHSASAVNTPGNGQLERLYSYAERLAQRLNNKDIDGIWRRDLVLEHMRATGEEPINAQMFAQLFEQRFNTFVSHSSDWHVDAVRDGQILLSNNVRGLPGVAVIYFRTNPLTSEPELLDWQLQDAFSRGTTVLGAYMQHAPDLTNSGFLELALQVKQGRALSVDDMVEVYHRFSDAVKQDPIIMGDYLSFTGILEMDLPQDILNEIHANRPALTLDNAQPLANLAAMAGDLDNSLRAYELGKAHYGETLTNQRLIYAINLASSGFIPEANKAFIEYCRAHPQEFRGVLIYFLLLVEMDAFDDAAVVKQAMRLQFQIDPDKEVIRNSDDSVDNTKLRAFMASPANQALN